MSWSTSLVIFPSSISMAAATAALRRAMADVVSDNPALGGRLETDPDSRGVGVRLGVHAASELVRVAVGSESASESGAVVAARGGAAAGCTWAEAIFALGLSTIAWTGRTRRPFVCHAGFFTLSALLFPYSIGLLPAGVSFVLDSSQPPRLGFAAALLLCRRQRP